MGGFFGIWAWTSGLFLLLDALVLAFALGYAVFDERRPLWQLTSGVVAFTALSGFMPQLYDALGWRLMHGVMAVAAALLISRMAYPMEGMAYNLFRGAMFALSAVLAFVHAGLFLFSLLV